MNNQQKKVSVLMPVYNLIKFKHLINNSIDSILNQSYNNWELIIIDDCSTDGTYEYIIRYISNKNANNIIVVRNLENFGCYVSLNKGICISSGDYITRIDSDDKYHRQKLKRQVDILNNNEKYIGTTAIYQHINNRNITNKNTSITLMFRRDVINKIGYYDSVRVVGDSDFYLRLLKYYGKNSIYVYDKILYYVNKRPYSLTTSKYFGIKNKFRYDYLKESKKNNDIYIPFPQHERRFDTHKKNIVSYNNNNINICIIYKIPKNNKIKYNNWTDGFTSAIKLLKKNQNITLINIENNHDPDLSKYNIIFFKENFNGNIYKKIINKIKNKKKGLFISASNIIPSNENLFKYDILFYETQWYYNYAKLNRHPNCYHAFGINTEIMKPKIVNKEYDVIFVGNIINYKRPLKILNKKGKKICIGLKTDNNIIRQLEKNNVECKDFTTYENLSDYYNKSKKCYIPCKLHGGGERAVLEARSCGIYVEIENDNPKLKELLTSPIYSHNYYAEQIENGIKSYYIKYNGINDSCKRYAYKNHFKIEGSYIKCIKDTLLKKNYTSSREQKNNIKVTINQRFKHHGFYKNHYIIIHE